MYRRQVRSGCSFVSPRFEAQKMVTNSRAQSSERMAVEVGHVLDCLGVVVVDHGAANERLTQVNIAWRRRNGCSSEQPVS